MIKQHRLNDAFIFHKDQTPVIVLKEELDILEIDNDMAEGIFQEIREVIEAQPCFHGVMQGTAPMFFPEHIMCIRNFAIVETYKEIIQALQKESLGYAANFVTDLLIERRRARDAQEKETKKEDEMGGTDKDSSSRK